MGNVSNVLVRGNKFFELGNVPKELASGAYKERLSYDANGNIQTYLRNSKTGASKNNYIYSYTASTNRLQGITNNVNTQTGTYSYDAIGNTTGDGMQVVTGVEWNVYGKVTKLINSSDENVTYTYSSDGQRISKTVGNTVEWYVRDATGNIMVTYQQDASISSGNVSTKEFYKYGSNLLAIKHKVIDMEVNSTGDVNPVVRGEDGYILTDHLGNTRAIASDKKIQVEDPLNPGSILYYEADVKSAYYYSAYGAISNKYGSDPVVAFNGQRKSDEIGENAQTALFWEYNGDVGRRWNVDPVLKYYESPYFTFAGNPNWIKDPSGADSIFYNKDGNEDKSRRVKMKGDHTYWLQHEEGNKLIGGQTYFQGNSYYSFFGDADRFDGPTLFKNVDSETIPDSKLQTINNLINQIYNGESYPEIFAGVDREYHGGKFDYKNGKLFNRNWNRPDEEPSNLYTAYLIDGILHNRNEAGLLLWGGTLGKTSVGYTGIYLDNKIAHLYKEKNNDELNEMNMWRKGLLIMQKAKNVEKYTNTFMYGVFGIHYDHKTKGVDPTNPDAPSDLKINYKKYKFK